MARTTLIAGFTYFSQTNIDPFYRNAWLVLMTLASVKLVCSLWSPTVASRG